MIEAFPLHWPDGWPRTPEHRRTRYGAFRGVTFGKARDDLMNEVRRLRGTDIILSTNVPLRRDGLPYADARNPEDPGVAIYFHRRGKRLCMARDAYIDCSHNLRSLAMAIECLRGLERHGGATMVERTFTGFAALPAPGAKRSCWLILDLGTPSDEGAPSVDMIERAYRERARKVHPDVGGSDAQMAELNEAREQALREIVS